MDAAMNGHVDVVQLLIDAGATQVESALKVAKNDAVRTMLRRGGKGKAPACAKCGKEAGMRCSVCKTAVYCSSACQHADWTAHKTTCKK